MSEALAEVKALAGRYEAHAEDFVSRYGEAAKLLERANPRPKRDGEFQPVASSTFFPFALWLAIDLCESARRQEWAVNKTQLSVGYAKRYGPVAAEGIKRDVFTDAGVTLTAALAHIFHRIYFHESGEATEIALNMPVDFEAVAAFADKLDKAVAKNPTEKFGPLTLGPSRASGNDLRSLKHAAKLARREGFSRLSDAPKLPLADLADFARLAFLASKTRELPSKTEIELANLYALANDQFLKINTGDPALAEMRWANPFVIDLHGRTMTPKESAPRERSGAFKALSEASCYAEAAAFAAAALGDGSPNLAKRARVWLGKNTGRLAFAGWRSIATR